MKYTKERVAEIIHLKKTTDLIDEEICNAAGISETTFYHWKNTKPDFSELLKEAEDFKLRKIKQLARQQLHKRLTGYDVEEKRAEYEYYTDENGKRKRRLKTQTVTTKHQQASDTLLMYSLNNTDREYFQHKEHVDHTSKGEKLTDFSEMTTDQILERAKAIKTIQDHERDK